MKIEEAVAFLALHNATVHFDHASGAVRAGGTFKTVVVTLSRTSFSVPVGNEPKGASVALLFAVETLKARLGS